MTPEVRKQIEEGVKEIAKKSTAPDKETPDWMETDIRRGAEFGYQLACNSSHPEQGEQGELYKWVKASENLPEFENRDKGYVVRYPNIPDTLAVWRWDWINQRIDNNCDLEILVKLSSPPPEGQDELWSELFADYHTRGKSIKELSKQYLLIKK